MISTMADMPNDFWSGWIILLTCFSFAGLAWLLFSAFFLSNESKSKEDEPVWDNDIREDNNPIPLWWFWLLLSMMIFSAAYLMLYPGLGSFSGAFHWSQGGELRNNMFSFNEEYAETQEEILNASIEALQIRPEVMRSASSLFAQHCSACHGADGKGQANVFPNLRDEDWQWGGSAEQIEQTIRNGRLAAMISWINVLGEDGVNNVGDYVLSSLSSNDSEADHPGRTQYNQFCIACHGAAGQGNPLFGAPNIKDDTWLYGGSLDTIRESIALGRFGEMPAFESRLDDVQIKMLVAWLLQGNQ